MLGLHLVLRTLHKGLQLVLRKTNELVTLNIIFSVIIVEYVVKRITCLQPRKCSPDL